MFSVNRTSAGGEKEEELAARRSGEAIFTAETFRFFRELGRNNRKEWMDENRERYREHVVAPFRRLLDALTPAVRTLHPGFGVGGRTGENFSRINRDIRFASDKSPYRAQMYLFFSRAAAPGRSGGQLYVGISAEAITVGFWIYSESRQSTLASVGIPRAVQHAPWIERKRKKFRRNYESYWYSSEKGQWTKHAGWPRDAKEWKKCKGWIVRRKFSPVVATRAKFVRDTEKIFRDLFPLFAFSSLPEWKP
jgi:uncharacterized protein (TIGR02453 family)